MYGKLIVMRQNLRLGLGVLAVVAIAAVWPFYYFRSVTVSVVSVERDVPVQVFGLGTVEARVQSQIGFKVSGILIDLRADIGDRIPKGAILAHLDDREQSALVAMAKATVELTEANLQKATASVEKAQANYANARYINQRQQALLGNKSTSVESAQTARAAQDAALADVNFMKSDVLVSIANISDARAQLLLQSTTLDFYTLTAPYDAMVITRLKETGSALSAGDPVFTIIDPQTVWVLAYIDESKAGDIKVDDVAEFALRSRPAKRIAGRVARIQPESDRVNEERRIEIAFDHIPDTFNLGEQAEVFITTVRLSHALLVSEGAIEGFGRNRGTIWVIADGHLQRRDVMLGHRVLDGRYEIIGGVPDNAAVISQLVRGLRVGRAATIAEVQSR